LASRQETPPPEALPPLPKPDIAAALGKARDLLAKVKLPPAVQQVVDNESDPTVIFNTLTDHMQTTLATLTEVGELAPTSPYTPPATPLRRYRR